MLQVGVGASTHPEPRRAGRVAARAALKQTGQQSCDLVLVFATVRYDQERLISTVREATDGAPLSGCSAESVLWGGTHSHSRHAVVVVTLKSDTLRIAHASAHGAADEIGASLARSLPLDDAAAVLTFADGLEVDFERFRLGFEASSPRPIPMFGALAADHARLVHTFQYHDDSVITGGVSGVSLCGPVSLASEVVHGFQPVGLPLTVTSADGSILYELEGRPILDVLEEYLGPHGVGESILDLSLGVEASPGEAPEGEEFAVRFMHSPDEETKSLRVSAPFPEGQKVWLMVRDRQKLLRGLRAMGRRLRQELDGRTPQMMFCFECAAGSGLGFSGTQREGWLSRWIGLEVPCAGFRAYGEIVPVAAGNRLHNNAITLGVLS